MLTQNLGFPRIGAKRELKKACEAYWQGRISREELEQAGRNERLKNWTFQQDSGIDLIPSNDFSFYDQVADMALIYDIHSPRVPGVDEMCNLLLAASRYIPVKNLWVNPDCGLKTRGWKETRSSIRNMVESARMMRETVLHAEN
ncbi:MAG: hypothetical protein AB2L20_27760 [Mangrovibacterium sp.]